MAINRYDATDIVRRRGFGTSNYITLISDGIKNGTINYVTDVMVEGKRLDSIAGEVYGDARLWWVIAAASGIGWSLQVPPNTILRIPSNISQVMSAIGL